MSQSLEEPGGPVKGEKAYHLSPQHKDRRLRKSPDPCMPYPGSPRHPTRIDSFLKTVVKFVRQTAGLLIPESLKAERGYLSVSPGQIPQTHPHPTQTPGWAGDARTLLNPQCPAPCCATLEGMCSMGDHFQSAFRYVTPRDCLHTTALRWTLSQSCPETWSTSECPQVSFPSILDTATGQTGFLAGCSYQVCFPLTTVH
ncbi:hypothetical protein PAL_GLEAN10006255 [Pteropus alecto]|uniref:Uncharacterized protein n=1 Tax=Pteropus alecto TaxID=9402 RepID=L5KG26_PTEAL|nr:hypothetical protein PAL_GLEAN10006255 [Pteropus alecto]